MISWPPGLFVVGTDTGVGKTRVAASIARTWSKLGRRVGVVKPVSTGGRVVDGQLRSTDVDALIRAIRSENSPFPPPPLDRVGPIIYPLPLAPPVAARKAGAPLAPLEVIRATEAAIEWWTVTARAEMLVVEGVGGLLCPLAERGWTVADLAIHLDYPLVIVAHRGLGTLNHTLMTVEVAQSRGLRIAGVILNATRKADDLEAEETNAAELAARLPGVAILADWPFNPPGKLALVGAEAGHWINLAHPPRVRLGGGSADPNTNVLIAQSRLVGSDDAIAANANLESLAPSSSDFLGYTPTGEKLERTSTANPSPLNLNLNRADPTLSGSSSSDERSFDSRSRSSLRSVILISYASAVTLALIWTLYQRRNDRRALPEVTALRNDRLTDSGRLQDRSRRIEAAGPIPDNRIVALGKSIEIDSLLIQPISVERGNLTLQRLNMAGKTERRDGGKRSVLLKVRLQNRSTDEVFAPVDPAFVRGRSDDIFLTYFETEDGRKVYPNPLAVDSEWSIIGESFADLRPGEPREVIFATEPNAPADIERMPGIWRIKLRTGLDSTAVIGVKVSGSGKP